MCMWLARFTSNRSPKTCSEKITHNLKLSGPQHLLVINAVIFPFSCSRRSTFPELVFNDFLLLIYRLNFPLCFTAGEGKKFSIAMMSTMTLKLAHSGETETWVTPYPGAFSRCFCIIRMKLLYEFKIEDERLKQQDVCTSAKWRVTLLVRH